MTVLTLGHMDEQTTEALTFFVPGKSQTAGSKRAMKHKVTGEVVVFDSGNTAAKRTWRADLKDAALKVKPMDWDMARAFAVLFVFARKRPQTHIRANGALKDWAVGLRPTTVPDSTKLTRAAEDALTGMLWLDDAQVVSLNAEKVYADQLGLEPRAEGMLVQVRAAGGYAGPLATGL